MSDSDLRIVKSVHTVDGVDSLGGLIASGVIVTESINSLWDNVTNAELTASIVGEYECRCVYIYNASPNMEMLTNLQVYVETNTASPFTDIDLALGSSGLGGTEQTLANENSIPVGVHFTFARGEQNALVLPHIPVQSYYPLWIRRHAGPAPSGSSTPSDIYTLGFKVLKAALPSPGPGGPGPGPPPPPPPCPGLPGL